MLAADQFREIFRLLFIIAPAADLVDAEVRVGTIAEADRCRRARYLLDRDDMFQIAEPESAPLLLDRDAVEAEFAHRRPQFIAWKPVLAIGAVGERSDLFVGEARGGLADHIGGFYERESTLGGGGIVKPLCRGGKIGRGWWVGR